MSRWRVRCACGASKTVLGANLRNGGTKSCGCTAREKARSRAIARNTRHGQTDSPAWRSWASMLERCENPRAESFLDYGGKGVRVCLRWHTFECFLADMGERPDGTTLDRHPNSGGNYEPGNCRWATMEEQNRNKGDTILVTLDNQTKCVGEWADHFGFPRPRVYARLKRGWSPRRALGLPETTGEDQ